MSLFNAIQDDIKDAMRAGESGRLRLMTLRMLKSELLLLSKEKDSQDGPPSDDIVIRVAEKMIKQRKESAKQFRDANHPDRAKQEEEEIDILQVYLPEPLDEQAIEAIVSAAIQEVSPESMRDMGKVMAIITPQVRGRADVGKISHMVKSKINA